MKSMKLLWISFLLVAACRNTIDDMQPTSKFEKSTDPLPAIKIDAKAGSSHVIAFDTIADGGLFSVKFTPFKHGKISILNNGKSVAIVLDTGNWEKDSSQYTISKNKVSRSGSLVFKNLDYKKPPIDTIKPPIDTIKPIDTSCSALADKKLFGDFLTDITLQNLFPAGIFGKADSVVSSIYRTQINTQGQITYFSNPDLQVEKWAFDTIFYRLKAANKKCYTGRVLVTLGDTCEPHARLDTISVPGGRLLFSDTLLVKNDKGCNGLLGSYKTTTQQDFSSGQYFPEKPTRYGFLTDTGVNGTQHYKYIRTNSAVSSDKFEYFFKNETTGRTTKAEVILKF